MSNFARTFTRTPQFQRGMDVERWLDDYFTGLGFYIKRTTAYQERKECLGDRLFTKNGLTKFIEYKSGIQTYYTGNVFLETISVDTQGKPGWVYTCQAHWVIYAALLNHVILFFDPAYLRTNIEILKARFREVPTHQQNATYKTWGVIVPLNYARKLATKVINLNGEIK